MITHLSPTMTACNDDNVIIERMKALGVYEEMQRLKQQQRDTAMFTKDCQEAFIWFAVKDDSGYVHIHTTNQAERLKVFILAAEIMNDGQLPDKSKMH